MRCQKASLINWSAIKTLTAIVHQAMINSMAKAMVKAMLLTVKRKVRQVLKAKICNKSYWLRSVNSTRRKLPRIDSD